MGQVIFGILMLIAAVLLVRLGMRQRRTAYRAYRYQQENGMRQPQKPRHAGLFGFAAAVVILLIAVLTLWDYWVYWIA